MDFGAKVKNEKELRDKVFVAANTLRSQGSPVTATTVAREIDSLEHDIIDQHIRAWKTALVRNSLKIVDLSTSEGALVFLVKTAQKLAQELRWKQQKTDQLLFRMKRIGDYRKAVEMFEASFSNVAFVINKPWESKV